MDVKPWEPVSSCLELESGFFGSPIYGQPWEAYRYWPYSTPVAALHVTLANGQRIIVRALSDERKAARAAMKEAKQ